MISARANPGTSWIVNETPSVPFQMRCSSVTSAIKFNFQSSVDVLVLIGGWPAEVALEEVGLFGWPAMSHGEPVP